MAARYICWRKHDIRLKPRDMFAVASTILYNPSVSVNLDSSPFNTPLRFVAAVDRALPARTIHSASLRYSGRSHASRAYHASFRSLFDPCFRLASSRTAGARLRATSRGRLCTQGTILLPCHSERQRRISERSFVSPLRDPSAYASG